jgi:hypothetical protein
LPVGVVIVFKYCICIVSHGLCLRPT